MGALRELDKGGLRSMLTLKSGESPWMLVLLTKLGETSTVLVSLFVSSVDDSGDKLQLLL